MSKTASAGFQTHLDGAGLTLATCFKVTRTDGIIQGFTDHDKDISFDLGDGDGEITYESESGYARTNVSTRSNFSVDNLDLQGILTSDQINSADLRAGRYDFAEIKIFQVNYEDLSLGSIAMRRGFVGEVNFRDHENMFVSELRGLMQYLTTNIVDLYTPDCLVDLGSAKCGVRLDPIEWPAPSPNAVVTRREGRDAATGDVIKPTTFNDRHFKCVVAGTLGDTEPTWDTTIGNTTADGTAVWEAIQALTIEAKVTSIITAQREFAIDYSGDATSELLTGGLCTWISSASPTSLNSGIRREVKLYTVSSPTGDDHVVQLFLPTPFEIQVDDEITISAGCQKDKNACSTIFDNIENFRGFAEVPGNDEAFRTPDAR